MTNAIDAIGFDAVGGEKTCGHRRYLLLFGGESVTSNVLHGARVRVFVMSKNEAEGN